VQHNAQERSNDLKAAIVFDETKFPEFVHEEIDARPRCANHLRKHLLRYFGKQLLSLAPFAIMGEQQQSPRQPVIAPDCGTQEVLSTNLVPMFFSGQQDITWRDTLPTGFPKAMRGRSWTREFGCRLDAFGTRSRS
jgi:hypothetical protein